jgi:hypothetical protein
MAGMGGKRTLFEGESLAIVATMNRVVFRATEKDLISAYRLNFLASMRRRRTWARFILGAAFFGVGSAVLLGNDIGTGLAAVVGAAYWFALLAIILLLNFLLLPRRTKRIFRQQKALHEVAEVEWSEESINFRSAQSHATVPWSHFVRLVEGRNMILLMQSDALFNFIPKASLSPEQAASIMAHR